jgi:hypothetical protein
MVMRVRGGDGDDLVEDCEPMTRGRAIHEINLGAGNDQAFVEVPSDPNDIPADPYELGLELAAGDGADLVRVQLGVLPPSGSANLEIDLGAGNDQAFVELPSDPSVIPADPYELGLQLAAGDGADLVQVQLGVLPPSGSANLEIDLGAGNDRAFVELPSDPDVIPADPYELGLQLAAGDGADLVQVRVGFSPAHEAATMSFDVDLGAGNDTADIRYVGGGSPDPGALEIKVRGGAGNDILRGDFNFGDSRPGLVMIDFDGGLGSDFVGVRYREAPGSSSEPPQLLHIHATGGDGNDQLAMLVTTSRPTAYLDLLLDGGGGYDKAFATANVTVVNCEEFPTTPPSDL